MFFAHVLSPAPFHTRTPAAGHSVSFAFRLWPSYFKPQNIPSFCDRPVGGRAREKEKKTCTVDGTEVGKIGEGLRMESGKNNENKMRTQKYTYVYTCVCIREIPGRPNVSGPEMFSRSFASIDSKRDRSMKKQKSPVIFIRYLKTKPAFFEPCDSHLRSIVQKRFHIITRYTY